jgi:hypothetical protein
MKIQYNDVNHKNALSVWRLWDTIVLNQQHAKYRNAKQVVPKSSRDYQSFSQPSHNDMSSFISSLSKVKESELFVEDLINFLFSQFQKNVPLGSHYLYVRPLLDPIKTFYLFAKHPHNRAGAQLTGIEFFNVNRFINFLIDIRSIKIFLKQNIIILAGHIIRLTIIIQ